MCVCLLIACYMLCITVSVLNFHPHVAELAKVKSLYQRKVRETSKLKHEPEESQTSLDKVCSLLAVLF